MTDLIPSTHASTTAPTRASNSSDLSSESIRSQKFDTSFRGYDTAQVRQFLSRVGVHVSNLHDQVAGLSLELDSARSVRPVIDLTAPSADSAGGSGAGSGAGSSEETVELLMTNEATTSAVNHMLEEAHREAKLIIDRANAEAGRILLRARAESRGKQLDGGRVLTSDAAATSVARSSAALGLSTSDLDGPVGLGDTDNETDAETPDAAREQARAMIGEARAVRERILTDLAKRRRTAHVQLEQLRAGREKLLETMREARRVVDAATADLQHAETEARLAAEAAGRRVSEEPMQTADQLGAELTGGRHLASVRHLPLSSVSADVPVEVGYGVIPEVAPEVPEASVAEAVVFPEDPDVDEAPTVELRLADMVDVDMAGISDTADGVTVIDVIEVIVVESADVLVVDVIEGDVNVELEQFDSAPMVSDEDLVVVSVVEVVDVAVITAEDLVVTSAEQPVSAHQLSTSERSDDSAQGSPLHPAHRSRNSSPPVSEPAPVSVPVIRKRSAGAAFAKLRAEQPAPATTSQKSAESNVVSTVKSPTQAETASDRVTPVVKDKSRPASRRGPVDLLPNGPASAEPSAVTAAAATGLTTVPLSPATTVAPAPISPGVDVAVTVLERRSAELELLQLRVTRRLKRQLQDDHSAALSSVRRTRGHATMATLLGDPVVSLARLVGVLESGMDEACESGRRSMAMILGCPVNERRTASDATPLSVAQELAQRVLTEISESVDAGLADGSSEYATVLGAAFREWSTERIGREVATSLCSAFGIGSTGQIETGTLVGWVVEHGDDPSPDCDDNSLAGSVILGQTFPTGHALPPLGAGCRCIVVPAAG